MSFQVNNHRICYILNKSANATPELFAIKLLCKMRQSSKANKSASESSKTDLCIKVKDLRMLSRVTHESHLNVTGVQFFR